ncbi:MAG: hypothetical protein ACHQ0J_06590 [Candidatus Dormibacterales bacterium]
MQSHETIDRVRIPSALLLVLAGAVVTVVVLLYLTRRYDFYYDEWDYVLGAPNWTISSYFAPHSEHWSTLLMLWYKAGISIFGARNYRFFMAGVLTVDAAVACLLFVLIRRRAGDVLALAAAVLMLDLGRGWENILWGFQIGFAGSVAFGLVATLLIQDEKVPGWRLVLASGALLCALMCVGVGLFWWVLVAVDLLFSPPRRRYLWILVVPMLCYLVWYAAAGHTTIAGHRSPVSITAVLDLASFVPTGIGAAIAGVFGQALRWGELALALSAFTVGAVWVRRRWKIDSLVLGAAAGLIAQFVLIGLVRAQYGDLEAAGSRYVWVAGVFVLVIAADTVRGLPLYRLTQVALLLILVVSVVMIGSYLHQQVLAKNLLFATQDAELQVTWMLRNAPGLDRNAKIDATLIPSLSVGKYLDSRRLLGSHVAAVDPAGAALLDPAGVNLALADDLPARLVLVPTPSSSQGTCVQSDANGISDEQGTDRSVWLVTPTSAGPVTITIWYAGAASSAPSTTVVVGAGQSLQITLPDSGLGLAWRIEASVPTYLGLSFCST